MDRHLLFEELLRRPKLKEDKSEEKSRQKGICSQRWFVAEMTVDATFALPKRRHAQTFLLLLLQ